MTPVHHKHALPLHREASSGATDAASDMWLPTGEMAAALVAGVKLKMRGVKVVGDAQMMAIHRQALATLSLAGAVMPANAGGKQACMGDSFFTTTGTDVLRRSTGENQCW